MKIEDILTEINIIKASVDDDEGAHSMEDGLREEFIRYVAKRKDHLGKKARLILTTNDIDFRRWYA